MDEITFHALDARTVLPYRQYLLPQCLENADEQYLGAAAGRFACAAAAFHTDGGAASLDSLFVDPLVRGRGIGTELMRRAVSAAKAQGAETLTLSYVLDGEELDAMDRLVRAMGAQPRFTAPVYTVDTASLHTHPLLGEAFRFSFHQREQIVTFQELDKEQRSLLDTAPEIPAFVRPARRTAADGSLSFAWLTDDGRVGAYLLGCESTQGEYTLLAAWRGAAAPPDAFHALLLAQLHRCFYRCGGDYLYHMSAATARSEALVQRYTGGAYRRREAHEAHIRLTDAI